jgi:exodeoxyribonuclease VII large subunit
MQRRVERLRSTIAQYSAQLDALSPLAVLGRGYAVPRDRDGKVLRRTADFAPGTPFTLSITDGTIAARVED